MKVKALTSFSGLVTMIKNEIKDIQDKSIYDDLIRVGYVEVFNEAKPRKKVKLNENK